MLVKVRWKRVGCGEVVSKVTIIVGVKLWELAGKGMEDLSRVDEE